MSAAAASAAITASITANITPTATAAAMASEAARPDPAVALRRALGGYPTGVTVVTTRAPDGRAVGLTVNSFASLSLDPPLLLWSLSNRSPNLRVFRSASHFAINVLALGQQALALRFASAQVADKFEGVALQQPAGLGKHPPPLLAGALAWFVCRSRDAMEAGDHSLFTGCVEQHGSTAGEPLVFHGGGFTRLG